MSFLLYLVKVDLCYLYGLKSLDKNFFAFKNGNENKIEKTGKDNEQKENTRNDLPERL